MGQCHGPHLPDPRAPVPDHTNLIHKDRAKVEVPLFPYKFVLGKQPTRKGQIKPDRIPLEQEWDLPSISSRACTTLSSTAVMNSILRIIFDLDQISPTQ